jgi:hypothetical protein
MEDECLYYNMDAWISFPLGDFLGKDWDGKTGMEFAA